MKSSLTTSGKSLQEKFIQEFTEVSKSIQVSSKYNVNRKSLKCKDETKDDKRKPRISAKLTILRGSTLARISLDTDR
jgi:hypothetical protein